MSNPEQPAYPAQQQPAQPQYGAPQPYGTQPQYGGQPQYGAQPYGAQPGSPYPYAYAPEPRTNVLAIISLVSAFFVSLAAVITGHIALAQIKRTGENGRGLALAGLIIGYVGIGAGVLFFLAWLPLFFAVMGHSMSTSGISS
ncbi:DUF4190 domain-containing protein [Leifsonia shinshuensis]|uniref:DUF4190 domain-containing protein n=1 Tax=Leifsonia shinshuensis TaxID=150026 RepID=UPI001F50ABB1|nr:DUF4190 domain-containing protein [Leifsonia shinshuensis]MCI0156352.1 DUF4190 domain-containing protein [Leifsonia shinshuensis]